MSEEKVCLVCGKNITALNGTKISEGRHICFNCKKFSGVIIFRNLRKMSDAQIRDAVAAHSGIKVDPRKGVTGTIKDKVAMSMADAKRESGEAPDNGTDDGIIRVKGVLGEGLIVDKNAKEISYEPVTLAGGTLQQVSTYSFDDILSYELLEDVNTSRKKGVCTGMKVRIGVDDPDVQDIYIYIINRANVELASEKYTRAKKTAGKIITLLDMIKNDALPGAEQAQQEPPVIEDKEPDQANAETSVADELREYKQLYDEGVITREEFEAKKAQLLNLP